MGAFEFDRDFSPGAPLTVVMEETNPAKVMGSGDRARHVVPRQKAGSEISFWRTLSFRVLRVFRG
jgi:hypothetical protein